MLRCVEKREMVVGWWLLTAKLRASCKCVFFATFFVFCLSTVRFRVGFECDLPIAVRSLPINSSDFDDNSRSLPGSVAGKLVL